MLAAEEMAPMLMRGPKRKGLQSQVVVSAEMVGQDVHQVIEAADHPQTRCLNPHDLP